MKTANINHRDITQCENFKKGQIKIIFNSPERWLTAARWQSTDMWSSWLFVERLSSCQTVLDFLSCCKQTNKSPSDWAVISCQTWGEIKSEEDGPEMREKKGVFSSSFRKGQVSAVQTLQVSTGGFSDAGFGGAVVGTEVFVYLSVEECFI